MRAGSPSVSWLLVLSIAALVFAFPALAAASPGGGVDSLLAQVIHWLCFVVGPGVVILALCIGALCVTFGMQGAVMKCVMALVGGLILWGSGAIVSMLQSWAN